MVDVVDASNVSGVSVVANTSVVLRSLAGRCRKCPGVEQLDGWISRDPRKLDLVLRSECA